MDNDNEIKGRYSSAQKNEDEYELAHREVRLLLKNELKNLEFGSSAAYDLEAEYAKTKKNHNTTVSVLMISCFLAVGLVSFGITKYVTKENKNIAINIDTFNDLNLRGLLDMVSRTDGLYRSATKKRADFQASLDYGLKQAVEKRDNDLFTLQSLALRDKAEIAERKSAIQNEYKKSIKKLHDEYDVQIQSSENEIQQYQGELAAYDSTKVVHAQEQEAAIDSQRQLHDLEMQNQTKKYEASISDLRNQLDSQQQESVKAQRAAVAEVTTKYQAQIAVLDPVIKNTRGDAVIAAEKNVQISSPYSASSYTSEVQPGEALASALRRVQSLYGDFDYTADIVSSIPWENTMSSYVRSLRQLSHEIGDTVSSAAVAESAQLQKKISFQQVQINVQNSYLESVAVAAKSDGFILDVSDRSMMPVYVAKSALAKVTTQQGSQTTAGSDLGTDAFVKQGKRTYRFSVQNKGGVLYAVPPDVREAAGLKAGDVFTIGVPSAEKK
jgi:hypothetical protein